MAQSIQRSIATPPCDAATRNSDATVAGTLLAAASAMTKEIVDKLDVRYPRREVTRRDLQTSIEEKGVFGAAGNAASCQRIQHMSVEEGHALHFGNMECRDTAPIDDGTVDVHFFGRGIDAVNALCRIVRRGQDEGVGFFVAPNLILTTRAVVGSLDVATECSAEVDLDDGARKTLALDPAHIFATSASPSSSFVFIGVKGSGIARIPLIQSPNKILVGEHATTVHARGRARRFAIFGAPVIDKVDNRLQYTTQGDAATPGSPVFNRSWQVVALHHESILVVKPSGRQIFVNEGYRLDSIFRELSRPDEHARKVLNILRDPLIVRDGRPYAVPAARSAESRLEHASYPRPGNGLGDRP